MEICEQPGGLLRRHGRAVQVEVRALQGPRCVVFVEPADEYRIRISERNDTAADRLEPGAFPPPRHSTSAPRTTSRQPFPYTSSNGRPPSLPCTDCVPAWAAVGWMKPAVMAGSPGAGAGSSPTPAAIASSRAAASAGSATQITPPSSMEKSMAAFALGNRSY